MVSNLWGQGSSHLWEAAGIKLCGSSHCKEPLWHLSQLLLYPAQKVIAFWIRLFRCLCFQLPLSSRVSQPMNKSLVGKCMNPSAENCIYVLECLSVSSHFGNVSPLSTNNLRKGRPEFPMECFCYVSVCYDWLWPWRSGCRLDPWKNLWEIWI